MFFARLWTFSSDADDPQEFEEKEDDTKSEDRQAKPGPKDNQAVYLKLFNELIDNTSNTGKMDTTLKRISAYVENRGKSEKS
jgi:hypothetical protein